MRIPKVELSPIRWLAQKLRRSRHFPAHALDPESDATKAVLRDVSKSVDAPPRAVPDVLMPLRIQVHGLDPDYIAAAEPETYQALEETCAQCGSQRQCARDLSTENADARLNGYCANTEALDRLLLRK